MLRARTFVQRCRDYLSVIIVGAVLVFFGVGLMASAMSTTAYESVSSIQAFGALIEFGTRLVPFLFIVAAFASINVLVPITRIRPRSVMIGTAGRLNLGSFSEASPVVSTCDGAKLQQNCRVVIEISK